MSDVNRDRALSATVWFLLTKTPPWDPVEWRPRIGCDISFEDAGKIIGLLRQFTADWPIYTFIETLVDSATGSAYRDNFKRGQRAEIARQLEELVAEEFPNDRFIRHDGYKIVSAAQLNRLKESKETVPQAALAADAEVIDIPSGATLYGPDGHKRLLLFFAENFPDCRIELTDVFATEDRVALEGTWRWYDTDPLPLASGALPSMRRSGELRCCFVYQIRNGKIVSIHHYYDMMTMMEQLGLVPATGQTKE